jgi:hypothetical protein
MPKSIFGPVMQGLECTIGISVGLHFRKFGFISDDRNIRFHVRVIDAAQGLED